MKELRIDAEKVKNKLVRFIRQQTKQAGFKRVILGLSGGVDSSLALCLCCLALGRENAFGLILPYKSTSSESIACAKLISRKYQVRTRYIEISEQIDAYFKHFPQADKIRQGNKMARERMTILYDQAKELNALVVGTSNRSEILLGYGTVYGDLACAFNPLGNLYKTQILQLAGDLGLPKRIIQQSPSAGLWVGQSDEKELGLTYRQADKLFYYMIDKKYSLPKLIRMGFKDSFVQKVKKRIQDNAFKGTLPAIAKI